MLHIVPVTVLNYYTFIVVLFYRYVHAGHSQALLPNLWQQIYGNKLAMHLNRSVKCTVYH